LKHNHHYEYSPNKGYDGFTFRSGMGNLLFTDRLFCLLVAAFKASYAWAGVLSPGTEITQYSDIVRQSRRQHKSV